jgi:hypothetical protein
VKKFLATVVMFALMAVPTAVANPGSPPLKRERHKYLVLYFKVRAKDGKRAPGRQILRQGVRLKNGKSRDATAKDVSRSIRQLRLILHPYLVARPPGQPPAGVYHFAAGSTLQRIAQCESGGNPSTDTGNGFYGKYQFTLSTWAGVGGHGNPAHASEAEQDMRAAILYSRSGPAPWPVCGYR